MNIICIQVGYMAGAGISWLARINDYMEPTDVGGPATPRTPRLALYLLRPPTPFTLALSLNALLMATAYNLWRPLSYATLSYPASCVAIVTSLPSLFAILFCRS